jgi:predicted nucleotidyltransferase component of viral defense system
VSQASPTNLPASIRQRLLNIARQRGDELQSVLLRYGVERLLYRLSRSDERRRLVLKGAALFYVWEGGLRRPTRDVDFLGFGDESPQALADVFSSLCVADVTPDGLTFHAASVRAEAIRATQEYGGVRVSLSATLAGARIPLSIDIGFGDVVTPRVETATFPPLLDLPPPRIRVYPPETVIAEKYEAMVSLGIVNTRMKDLYDVWILSEDHAFDGAMLSTAIAATFARRRTPIPGEVPVALSALFGRAAGKQGQWAAFLNRSRLIDAPSDLATVSERLGAFLWPVTKAATDAHAFTGVWLPEIGWSSD